MKKPGKVEIKKAFDAWPGWTTKKRSFEHWAPMKQTFEGGYRAGYEAAVKKLSQSGRGRKRNE